MIIQYYEIESKSIHELTFNDFKERSTDGNGLHICDIKIDQREEAVKALRPFMEGSPILEYILDPPEHIRFEYLSEFAYGEFAFFSSNSENPIRYVGVIHRQNTLFFVHDLEEIGFSGIFNVFPSLIASYTDKLEAPLLLYIIINEILTADGKLILSYREEIEDVAKELHKDESEIDPGDILEFKTHLSDFNRVLEKLFFTLSFPPARSIVAQTSPYRQYFQELLKTINVLKISISKSEERLDSLHDHFNLLIQDKSNKRLNFLTIIQAIFVPLTLVTGIYGMNFQNMPELGWKYGYFFLLGALVLIASIFLRYFYKHRWFE